MKVSVTPEAAADYKSLDASLQEEIREVVAEIAEFPVSFLARTEIPGIYRFQRESQVSLGFFIRLLFRGWDDDPQVLVLVAIQLIR